MSGWRLSAGDLDSPHCLGEVEGKILVDTAFVLDELTCPSQVKCRIVQQVLQMLLMLPLVRTQQLN